MELTEGRDFGVYADGMDAGLDMKLADLSPTVDRVPAGGRVIDVGCGTGSLLSAFAAARPDVTFVGLDCSDELATRATAATDALTNVEIVVGDAQDLSPALVGGKADAVVFSSVLHEVLSYSGYDHGRVAAVLAAAMGTLSTSGRLVLRDGLAPAGRERLEWLRCIDGVLDDRLERFAVDFRPAHPEPGIEVERKTFDGQVWWRLARGDAFEFLSKMDYVDNWDCEVMEEFGVFTARGWVEALRRAGGEVARWHSYRHPWVETNRWAGRVELHVDLAGRPGWQVALPDTTIIVEADASAP